VDTARHSDGEEDPWTQRGTPLMVRRTRGLLIETSPHIKLRVVAFPIKGPV
jgi:hypothetical protein